MCMASLLSNIIGSSCLLVTQVMSCYGYFDRRLAALSIYIRYYNTLTLAQVLKTFSTVLSRI